MSSSAQGSDTASKLRSRKTRKFKRVHRDEPHKVIAYRTSRTTSRERSALTCRRQKEACDQLDHSGDDSYTSDKPPITNRLNRLLHTASPANSQWIAPR